VIFEKSYQCKKEREHGQECDFDPKIGPRFLRSKLSSEVTLDECYCNTPCNTCY